MVENTPQRRLLILTAVRLEAKAVARSLGLRAGEGRIWEGLSADRGRGIRLEVIGIGAVGQISDLRAFEGVILAGLAGALSPALAIGDVVCDGHSHPLPAHAGWQVGTIHTAVRLVTTPTEKAELFAATGALAVDMENARVRAEIDRVGVPFVHVRAISDTAAEGVDPAVLGLIDEYGDPKPAAVAGTLLRRPNLVPVLTRLGRNSKLAAGRLAEAVRTICASGWPEVGRPSRAG